MGQMPLLEAMYRQPQDILNSFLPKSLANPTLAGLIMPQLEEEDRIDLVAEVLVGLPVE